MHCKKVRTQIKNRQDNLGKKYKLKKKGKPKVKKGEKITG